MYVRTPRRQRKTLGDWNSFWAWGTPDDYGSPAWYAAEVSNALAWSPGLTNNNAIPTASAPPSQDWLWNAVVTGPPTDATQQDALQASIGLPQLPSLPSIPSLPSASSITSWAWIVMAGVMGLIVATK